MEEDRLRDNHGAIGGGAKVINVAEGGIRKTTSLGAPWWWWAGTLIIGAFWVMSLFQQ